MVDCTQGATKWIAQIFGSFWYPADDKSKQDLSVADIHFSNDGLIDYLAVTAPLEPLISIGRIWSAVAPGSCSNYGPMIGTWVGAHDPLFAIPVLNEAVLAAQTGLELLDGAWFSCDIIDPVVCLALDAGLRKLDRLFRGMYLAIGGVEANWWPLPVVPLAKTNATGPEDFMIYPHPVFMLYPPPGSLCTSYIKALKSKWFQDPTFPGSFFVKLEDYETSLKAFLVEWTHLGRLHYGLRGAWQYLKQYDPGLGRLRAGIIGDWWGAIVNYESSRSWLEQQYADAIAEGKIKSYLCGLNVGNNSVWDCWNKVGFATSPCGGPWSNSKAVRWEWYEQPPQPPTLQHKIIDPPEAATLLASGPTTYPLEVLDVPSPSNPGMTPLAAMSAMAAEIEAGKFNLTYPAQWPSPP